MKKIFRGQVILSAVYTVTAIVVFLYTLVFMTEYNDLFGLKMPQNKQIAQFYEVILQGFNRQILVWAIVGIIGILMIVLLEIRTAVPDRFAAAVMTVYMGCCCFGAVNAIRNILAIWAYYKGLDFQYLYADGITGYELKFTTFQVGIGIYSVQIIVCVAFAALRAASSAAFTFSAAASYSACTLALSSLMILPMAGRSSGATVRRFFIRAGILPFLLRYSCQKDASVSLLET